MPRSPRADIERRIAQLEKQFEQGHGIGTNQFNPLRRSDPLERMAVWGEAIQRLTLIEMAVFDSLINLRQCYPGLSGAEFRQLMSPLQRMFEEEWMRLVRSVMRERAGEIEPDEDRRGGVRKRAVEEIEQNAPPWWWMNP